MTLLGVAPLRKRFKHALLMVDLENEYGIIVAECGARVTVERQTYGAHSVFDHVGNLLKTFDGNVAGRAALDELVIFEEEDWYGQADL